MAGTPRGPVRLLLKGNRNRRIEPDLQGTPGLLISVEFWPAKTRPRREWGVFFR
jgi:hypothetical protein